MTKVSLSSPFGDEPLVEMPLSRAPLVRTLAQVRFPSLSVLAGGDAALRIAEALSDDYPIFHESQELTVQISPDGVTQMPGGGRLWQLKSADESWQVSFGQSFLSLHTSNYIDRDDFCRRLQVAWEELSIAVKPPSIQRVGFRYINRVEDEAFLGNLGNMVRPEVVGGSAVPLNAGQLVSSFSENLYEVSPNHALQARWGILPPNALLDPTLPGVDRKSWILDLDSYRNYTPADGTDVDVVAVVADLGRAGYRFFRWAVTAEFLQEFGGEI